MNAPRTVTSENWSVSVTTGTGIAGAILNVRRYFAGEHSYERSQPGEADNMKFASSDEAFAFALERGYTRRMENEWCPHCRTLHRRPAIEIGNKIINHRLFRGFTWIQRVGWSRFGDGAYWKKGCAK